MKIYTYDTIVVGSGCAGLNAGDWLFSLGRKNIALVTEGLRKGTSRNTGSDKQTYYKLSLSGCRSDSVVEMANTLFSGGSVDGPIALAEAACSVKCFMKLNLLGVDFPTDEFGQFVGYKTDHDPRDRGSSVGPLTSHHMTEALENSIKDKKIPLLDDCQIIKILQENGQISGAIGIQGNEYIYIACNSIIWCTGGPSGIYKDVVYPESQRGMTGILLECGAKGVNLEQWQYGIASTAFRWNLSGSYQQVLPRYVSVDDDGNEREFLGDYKKNFLPLVFLKGYQWPFDSRKIAESSAIDLAVYSETVVKGRRVFLDYRSNPYSLDSDFTTIGEEAREYLDKSGILFGTPIERLQKMNPLAITLYKDHGIDLYKEMLEIRVCAQCHNGGILVDENWQSTISGLYVAGEAAGTFGPYRPGGSALNSAQVGSMRAAQHIARTRQPEVETIHLSNAIMQHLGEFETFDTAIANVHGLSCIELANTYKNRMSSFGSYVRDIEELKKIREDLTSLLPTYFEKYSVPMGYGKSLLFSVYDQLLTTLAVVESLVASAALYGSFGGAITMKDGNVLENISDWKKYRLITEKNNSEFYSYQEEVRPIPKGELWFENVWAEHMKVRQI